MATPIKTIQDTIIAAKNSKLELSEIESDSKVSIFNAWAYAVAVAIHSLEVILDLFKNEINSILDSKEMGVPQYYVNKAYSFQDGDTIEVSADGLTVAYPVEDVSKQIITRASYEETNISAQNNDKLLLLKVAKGDVGALEPLSSEQMVRFTAYINAMKFAGTNIQPVSKIGDILLPRFTVYHDGTLPDSVILAGVEEAIHNFLINLSFDSAMYVSKLFDAVQGVSNVTDVYVDQSAVPAQGVFLRDFDDNGVMQAEKKIERYTHLTSGYMRESTKKGQELTVGNFSDSLIIKSE